MKKVTILSFLAALLMCGCHKNTFTISIFSADFTFFSKSGKSISIYCFN